ncbi:hypothetical protein CKAH01_06372 [Colletotrichum kahawae]|uniref:Suppressor of anucleate metulae protein B n=1 Tax=Colletotrichum kahawae TaxID=34407 RepID=A0AAE0D3T3_COLKA|nr:hypothetical protein CKAH01_06372 [Colletotrichum kahawae]
MPTLRFFLQLDEYKPAPETTAEPRPTDVAVGCKQRWALHEYVRTAFFSPWTPEQWQDDEDTEEKACAVCNAITVPRKCNRCSICETTYCDEVCRGQSFPCVHDNRFCTKFAEFRTEQRPSEHHYRAVFFPCTDEPQFVWLKVTFADSIGKLHIETDRQEAFEYVKEMKLPAASLTFNNDWIVPVTPYGVDLITFNTNENTVRQEKWLNHSLLGLAPPGHVGLVYGPAFLIAYNVDSPLNPIDIGENSSATGNGPNDEDDVGGEADGGDEGEEGDEEDDNESERNEAESGTRKAKSGSARRKKGKSKGKGKRKKRVPRPKRTADADKADKANAQDDNEAPVDIPDARGLFKSCRDIGIREIDFAIKCYILNPTNPVDGAHWMPVHGGCSGYQMHAIKINNLMDGTLFISQYSGQPCAAMYSLGLRWHLQCTMPSGAPQHLSGADEDPKYVASEQIFGDVICAVEEGSIEKLGVRRLVHLGSFTLAQVNGGEILPDHIMAVRAYHEDAFLNEYEDEMSEQGFREYWERLKADRFINQDVPSPYDLEQEDNGLCAWSKEVRARMQRTRRSE